MTDSELRSTLQILLERPFAGRGLSKQQEGVANLIGLGKTQKQVGEILCLSENTVKAYLKEVKKKTKMGSRELIQEVFMQIKAVLD